MAHAQPPRRKNLIRRSASATQYWKKADAASKVNHRCHTKVHAPSAPSAGADPIGVRTRPFGRVSFWCQRRAPFHRCPWQKPGFSSRQTLAVSFIERPGGIERVNRFEQRALHGRLQSGIPLLNAETRLRMTSDLRHRCSACAGSPAVRQQAGFSPAQKHDLIFPVGNILRAHIAHALYCMPLQLVRTDRMDCSTERPPDQLQVACIETSRGSSCRCRYQADGVRRVPTQQQL